MMRHSLIELRFPANGSRYVQAIDTDQLMQIATESNTLIQLQRRPGDFVVKGSPLAVVYPAASGGKKLVNWTLTKSPDKLAMMVNR